MDNNHVNVAAHFEQGLVLWQAAAATSSEVMTVKIQQFRASHCTRSKLHAYAYAYAQIWK